jgi:hypothetical protein
LLLFGSASGGAGGGYERDEQQSRDLCKEASHVRKD